VTSRPDHGRFPLTWSDVDDDVGPGRSKRVRRAALDLDDITPHPAPARWREQYDLIAIMRSRETADVDTMGCQLAQAVETDPVVSWHKVL
jgi:hypothetical protein